MGAGFKPVMNLIVGLVEQDIAAGIFRPVADINRVVETMAGVVAMAHRLIVTGTPNEVVQAETTEFLLGTLRIHGAPYNQKRGRGEQGTEGSAAARAPPAAIPAVAATFCNRAEIDAECGLSRLSAVAAPEDPFREGNTAAQVRAARARCPTRASVSAPVHAPY